jgi:DNA topoisomerase-1
VTVAEPEASARAAGLRYVTDDRPGIRRLKARGGFRYVDPQGNPVSDRDELARIRALAIPPAYTDVWIAPLRNAHLQATGRDARGRKQYRYHKRWRETRDETKFDRMIAFAKALPRIRAAVARDLALRGMPREKVLATVVALLESTMIRIGNDEYARDNDSYGLTTMQDDHVRVRGDEIRFAFRGKSGVEHKVAVRDRRLAKIVRACQDIPGQTLFTYVDDDGAPASIDSQDVNDYLRAIAGDDFTAKDFRTWEGTMGCALALAAQRAETKGEAKTAVLEAIRSVATRLGNTPSVCRKSYIHPAVIDEFVANGALELVAAKARRAERDEPHALRDHEARVVAFIERIVARDEKAHLGELLAKSVAAISRSTGPSPTTTRTRSRRSSRTSRSRPRRD